MGKRIHFIPILVLIAFVSLVGSMAATLVPSRGTHVGFYSTTCPQVEAIVRATVKSHFRLDPTVAPGLLRMHFHDCFVRGCDASVLLVGPRTERAAPPNLSLNGFEVINDAKSRLERACPGIVSCADILALAARDSVVLTKGVSWGVPTGRRDGRVSLALEANNALPKVNDTIQTQRKLFKSKGLNIQDLVTLVGAHTIGTTACSVFKYRLYNFSTTTRNGADPAMNPSFVHQLRTLCPKNGEGSPNIGLDISTPNQFDTSFFSNLRNGRGVLESDQKLWNDPSTRAFVRRFLLKGSLGLNFDLEFGKSMVKMSNIGVKTGTRGEIRKICTMVN
ncbi:Peroxidase N1, partial [Cucurbita argyrosperma subsp. sororia]